MIVALLFIPGSIGLDYLQAGFLNFGGLVNILILAVVYALVPAFSLSGTFCSQIFKKEKVTRSEQVKT